MKVLFSFILLMISLGVAAQQHDNVWPLGAYAGAVGSFSYPELDFSNGHPDTIITQRKIRFFTSNAAISDSAGALQFCSNGVWIANNQQDTMLNSQGFNPGWANNFYYNGGMGLSQSVMVIPLNADSGLYYLIHESAEYFSIGFPVNDAQPLNLMYTIVDMKLDSGKGGVVINKKNVIAVNDTLILGRIAACKHANGRDWWVVVHKYNSDIYYKLLFTPDSVYGPFTQSIGSYFFPKQPAGEDSDAWGMACFSPDGSQYITIGLNRTLEVLDFDRCNGMFYNSRTTTIPLNQGYTSTLGCSFSPNSKYIYVNTFMRTYQFNSDSTVLDNSRILVAEYDTFLNPYDTWFFLNQLGPDGRIYISTYNGSYVLHLIENPDSAGIACNFNKHGLMLSQGYGTNVTLPTFPNYRLGRLIGSPCDTLTSLANAPPLNINLSIIPNPNNGNFIINYNLPQNKSGTLKVFDVMGNCVYAIPLPQWSILQNINLNKLAAGVYFVKVSSDKYSATIKLVKNKF